MPACRHALLPHSIRGLSRRVLRRCIGWVIATSLIVSVLAAIEPSLGWLLKDLVDRLKDAEMPGSAFAPQLGLYALILGSLALVKVSEKALKGLTDCRIVIELQRELLESRSGRLDAAEISKLNFDCVEGRKGLEIVYKDFWKLVVGVAAVIVWQATLAADWLPAMLLTVFPPFVLVFVLGPVLQRVSSSVLHRVGDVTRNAADGRMQPFRREQERMLRGFVWLEFAKGCSEAIFEFGMWAIVVTLVIGEGTGQWNLFPKDLSLGKLALFAVNIHLLARPIGEIGRTYNKWRIAIPALVRIPLDADRGDRNVRSE